MSDTRVLPMPQDEVVSVLLDRLVGEYWYLLCRHIRLYIKHDRAMVEDIAQQTFEKALVALRSRYSTEQIANLKAKSWLMAIASHLCLDHIRYTQRVLSLELLQAVNSDPWADRFDPLVDLWVELVDLRSSPEYLLEVSEFFAEVQECIKAHVRFVLIGDRKRERSYATIGNQTHTRSARRCVTKPQCSPPVVPESMTHGKGQS